LRSLKLNTVLVVQPHYLPAPAGHTISNAALALLATWAHCSTLRRELCLLSPKK